MVVLDAQSRHLPSQEAYRRIQGIVRQARACGVDHFYKKADSTLRGNIGSELAAMLEESGGGELLFIPAFPATGRTVEGGRLYVHGIPISHTAFSKDPFHPVKWDEVSKTVSSQTALPVKPVRYDEYALLLREPETTPIIYTVDARSEDDLRRLQALLMNKQGPFCCAGCAGFAKYLPPLFGLIPGKAPKKKLQNKGAMLVVSGSLNAVTAAQIEYARDVCGYRTHACPVPMLLSRDEQPVLRWIAPIEADLRQFRRVTVHVPQGEDALVEARAYACSHGIEEGAIPGLISDCLGMLAKKLVDTGLVDILAIFGGDTLFSVIRSLSCRAVVPVRELQPGVVQADLLIGNTRMQAVTKSGGFSQTELMRQLEDFIEMDAW